MQEAASDLEFSCGKDKIRCKKKPWILGHLCCEKDNKKSINLAVVKHTWSGSCQTDMVWQLSKIHALACVRNIEDFVIRVIDVASKIQGSKAALKFHLIN